MFRGETVRTMSTTPAAALRTPAFLAPSPPFAVAYTARHVEAKAPLGATRSGERIREGAESAPVVPGAAYDPVSRPSTAHSPTAFQVTGR